MTKEFWSTPEAEEQASKREHEASLRGPSQVLTDSQDLLHAWWAEGNQGAPPSGWTPPPPPAYYKISSEEASGLSEEQLSFIIKEGVLPNGARRNPPRGETPDNHNLQVAVTEWERRDFPPARKGRRAWTQEAISWYRKKGVLD
jgi:hypothetical protein